MSKKPTEKEIQEKLRQILEEQRTYADKLWGKSNRIGFDL